MLSLLRHQTIFEIDSFGSIIPSRLVITGSLWKLNENGSGGDKNEVAEQVEGENKKAKWSRENGMFIFRCVVSLHRKGRNS
jgi:hypothetical protein